MSPLQAIILGVIQGLTEFLPISSSAHLYIVPTLLHWPYAGVAFDVALHWGTLVALLIAFGRDWARLLRDLFAADAARRRAARDTWAKLIVASIPGAIAGALLQGRAEDLLRYLPLQVCTLVVFGFLLWWMDRVRPQGDAVETPDWPACLGMGVAQAFALVPGVSRSGITITAGRLFKLERVSAARFSFLLATPITFGAGLLELRKLPATLDAVSLACGVIASAVVGLLAIHGLLRWLGRGGFGVFFAYRVALAAVIVVAMLRA